MTTTETPPSLTAFRQRLAHASASATAARLDVNLLFSNIRSGEHPDSETGMAAVERMIHRLYADASILKTALEGHKRIMETR